MMLLKDSTENTQQSYKQLYLYFSYYLFIFYSSKTIQLLLKNYSHQIETIFSSCHGRKRERAALAIYLLRELVFFLQRVHTDIRFRNMCSKLLMLKNTMQYRID